MKIVVTRHLSLVEYLLEIGFISSNEEITVLNHASPEQLKGKHVIGVLPMHLAAYAASITEIPLQLTPEMRGKELTLEELRKVAGKPVTYKVIKVE